MQRLQLNLRYRINSYENLQQYRQTDQETYVIMSCAVLPDLEQAYEAYHKLRLFLGKRWIGKYERKAREILEKEA